MTAYFRMELAMTPTARRRRLEVLRHLRFARSRVNWEQRRRGLVVLRTRLAHRLPFRVR
jgi:hypothetical protein